MRFGFDRLAQIARERAGCDPAEGGALFVLAGRAATRLKVLWFDRNGLCMLYKRLHRAVFELPTGGYMRDLLCLLPRWPRHRVLELAPLYWSQTLQKSEAQQAVDANVFRRVVLGLPVGSETHARELPPSTESVTNG